MSVDLSRLRRGEVIAGVSGVLLLALGLLLGWLRSGAVTRDMFDALPVLRWVILVTIAAAEALLVTQATRRGPAVPVSLSVVVTVLGGATVLLLVVRLLTTAASPRAGAYLGLGAAIALTYGGGASLRAEQGTRPDPARPIETVSREG